jgi:hypothetical protein
MYASLNYRDRRIFATKSGSMEGHDHCSTDSIRLSFHIAKILPSPPTWLHVVNVLQIPYTTK